ncbi:MAG: DNA base-flipping protein [Anaerolineales bacterium]|nr:DNA base-flipping protein [Anaerolineales bacterium]
MQQFHSLVWDLVRRIPLGRVATYGQIARMLPPPPGVEIEAYRAFGARWVGGAMANSPDNVPWQRVINAQGRISERPGAERQRALLEQEGVAFVKDKVDLKKFGWKGLGDDGEAAQPPLL